jgi:hypothetical protein
MLNVFPVYRTDKHHSFASRDLIGIGTTPFNAIELATKAAKKEGRKFSEDDLFNLRNYKQTQGYKGEGEFDYDQVALDTLL